MVLRLFCDGCGKNITKIVNTFEELAKIVPIETLRNTVFADERETEDDQPPNVMIGKRIFAAELGD